jgi:hypothetical protein
VHAAKVAVLGAAGGIGQPLSLLLKMNKLVDELALYDIANVAGVAVDLSHCNTPVKVRWVVCLLGQGGGALISLVGCPCLCNPPFPILTRTTAARPHNRSRPTPATPSWRARCRAPTSSSSRRVRFAAPHFALFTPFAPARCGCGKLIHNLPQLAFGWLFYKTTNQIKSTTKAQHQTKPHNIIKPKACRASPA